MRQTSILILILLIVFVSCCVRDEQMPNLTGKKVLFIIAPDNFRDEELTEPKAVLEKAGTEITIASSTGQPAKGMLGTIVTPDKNFYDVNAEDYDAIVFIGGSGASVYFNNSQALRLAKEFYSSGKIVCAICIAPSILANAGILADKKATAWPSERNNINAVGIYTGSAVEQDGNIITAKGPEAAKQFGQAIAKALGD